MNWFFLLCATLPKRNQIESHRDVRPSRDTTATSSLLLSNQICLCCKQPLLQRHQPHHCCSRTRSASRLRQPPQVTPLKEHHLRLALDYTIDTAIRNLHRCPCRITIATRVPLQKTPPETRAPPWQQSMRMCR